MHRAVLSSILILFLTLSAAAAGPARAPAQIALTPALVERFIASYEPVQAFNAKYDRKWAQENFADEHADGATRMRQSLEAHGALDDFNTLVRGYGFSGFENWWIVAYSTMMAYGFGDPEHDAAQASREIRQRLATLDQNKNLTDAQKTQYRAQLKTLLARYDALKPPQGNIEVVAPYRAKLDTLMVQDQKTGSPP